MIEVKIIGRGGQGVVSASALLASALFKEGYYTQAFPKYGVERAGGPASAFVRIDKKEIHQYDQIYAPYIMLVIDTTVLNREIEILETAGLMIINTHKSEKEIRKEFDLKQTCVVKTIDATKIGKDFIGLPFANVPMIGSFSGLTKLVSIKNLKKAIDEIWEHKSKKIRDSNKKAVNKAYDILKCEKCKVDI